jgi:hypothetical protein
VEDILITFQDWHTAVPYVPRVRRFSKAAPCPAILQFARVKLDIVDAAPLSRQPLIAIQPPRRRYCRQFKNICPRFAFIPDNHSLKWEIAWWCPRSLGCQLRPPAHRRATVQPDLDRTCNPQGSWSRQRRPGLMVMSAIQPSTRSAFSRFVTHPFARSAQPSTRDHDPARSAIGLPINLKNSG